MYVFAAVFVQITIPFYLTFIAISQLVGYKMLQQLKLPGNTLIEIILMLLLQFADAIVVACKRFYIACNSNRHINGNILHGM